MTLKATVLITRPRLVGLLLENGIECKNVPNPFNEKMRAWEVEETPEARAIIKAFYEALKDGERNE